MRHDVIGEVHYWRFAYESFGRLLAEHGWDLDGSYIRKMIRGKEVICEPIGLEPNIMIAKIAFRKTLEITDSIRPWERLDEPIRPEAMDIAASVFDPFDRKHRAELRKRQRP